MFLLCGYLLVKPHWHIGSNLSSKHLTGWSVVTTMLSAIALVVSYFSGPMPNFGDFSRCAKSFGAVTRGNFLGLPISFFVFSILTVVTAAATLPVFGVLIADHFLVRKEHVEVDDLFTMSPVARYWYRKGYHPDAVGAVILAGVFSIAPALHRLRPRLDGVLRAGHAPRLGHPAGPRRALPGR